MKQLSLRRYGNFNAVINYLKTNASLLPLFFLFFLSPLISSAKAPVYSVGAKNISISRHQKFYSPTDVTESVSLNLFLLNADNSTILADGDYAEYNNLYHDSVTIEDAYKFTNILENIGLLRYGKTLAVERRPIIVTNDTLFIKLWGTTQRSYQLELVTNLATNVGLQAFFEDSYLHTSTALPLENSTKINFNINADANSQATDRFKIVFRPKPPYVAPPVTFTSVKAYQHSGEIVVNWNVKDEVTTAKYEVEKSTDGVDFSVVNTTMVNPGNNTPGNYVWLDDRTVTGSNFYRIKGINLNGTEKYTSVVKVIGLTTPVSFNIYPNPVNSGNLTVQFIDQPVGYYQYKLLNVTGVVVLSGKVYVSSNNMQQMINIASVQKGIYQLEIQNAANLTQVKKIIIQ